MKNKGFTLIELLVVIAIIGILASVVLASLNSARDNAKDASMKTSMNSIRAQAELFYNGAGSNTYTGACADADIVNLLAAASTQTGNTADCDATAAAFAADVQSTVAGVYFCVDSSGFAGELSTQKDTTPSGAANVATCE